MGLARNASIPRLFFWCDPAPPVFYFAATPPPRLFCGVRLRPPRLFFWCDSAPPRRFFCDYCLPRLFFSPDCLPRPNYCLPRPNYCFVTSLFVMLSDTSLFWIYVCAPRLYFG